MLRFNYLIGGPNSLNNGQILSKKILAVFDVTLLIQNYSQYSYLSKCEFEIDSKRRQCFTHQDVKIIDHISN